MYAFHNWYSVREFTIIHLYIPLKNRIKKLKTDGAIPENQEIHPSESGYVIIHGYALSHLLRWTDTSHALRWNMKNLRKKKGKKRLIIDAHSSTTSDAHKTLLREMDARLQLVQQGYTNDSQCDDQPHGPIYQFKNGPIGINICQFGIQFCAILREAFAHLNDFCAKFG